MAPGTFGIIAPHPPIFVPSVGGPARHLANASLDALALAARALTGYRPDSVVLISPHAPVAADAFLVDTSDQVAGSLIQFGDEAEYSWPGDPELASHIIDRLDADDIPCASRDAGSELRPGWADHATIVPLHFLALLPEVRLVVLSLSFLSYDYHRRLGEIVASCADELGRKVAFVASGDLSHRLTVDASAGYSVRAAELDGAIVSGVRRGALSGLANLDPTLVEAGGECGLRSIITLGGFVGSDPVPTRVLAYEGPWGVGYLTALVGEDALGTGALSSEPVSDSGCKGGMPGTPESEIVSLARRSIEHFLGLGDAPDPILADEAYPQTAGAFVSLHRDGSLRGCIGTIAPTWPTLGQEVAHNAIQAATQDPRFTSLVQAELADLDIKVDVLHPPEDCELSDLDPSRYGVIVTHHGRRGLLLPDLDGVDDVPTQVSIALQKAGISPDAPYSLQRFLVDRHV
ncbi:MAG: AmmeMemoRadiSam system protein A [Coriobacteriia bacterium]